MPFLIWSIEHNAWWGPGYQGYTRTLLSAGLYSDVDSQRIVEQANRGPVVNECRIPADCVGLPKIYQQIYQQPEGVGR